VREAEALAEKECIVLAEEEARRKAEDVAEAEAAMIAAVEARRAAEARERQQELTEIAAREEAEILKHEEELREKERLEAELHSFSQWALQRSKDRLEAQQFAEMEQRRADEERERGAQVKVGMYKGQKGGRNKSRRMREEKARVEGERQEAQRLEANVGFEPLSGLGGATTHFDWQCHPDQLVPFHPIQVSQLPTVQPVMMMMRNG
jgi:hypothetical protein